MCGRFGLNASQEEITQEFSCTKVALDRPRYNIAPSQQVTVVIPTNKGREAIWMQWGLVPHWVKNPAGWKSKPINARVETVDQKNSFKQGFRQRPCLIPATSFFEWHRPDNLAPKQPYCFHTKRKLMALAGLYEVWTDQATQKQLLTCTILTTAAKGAIAQIHHRMPVLIQPEDYETWLGEYSRRKHFVNNLPEVPLQLYQVSDLVNSPKNDVSQCIVPVT